MSHRIRRVGAEKYAYFVNMSTYLAKTMVWKQDYDIKLCRHKQLTPNKNDHHLLLNENHMKIFCVRHCIRWGIFSRFSDKRPNWLHLLGAPKTKMALGPAQPKSFPVPAAR